MAIQEGPQSEKQKPWLGVATSCGSLDRKENEAGKQRVDSSRKKVQELDKTKVRKVDPSESNRRTIIFGS